MLHNIVIKQRKVYLPNNHFVQGGINSDEICLFVDPEWEECDTILMTLNHTGLEDSETPGTYLIQPGVELLIPKAFLDKPGLLYFSFTGYVGEEKRYTTEKMSTVYCGKVHPAGVIAEEGEDSHPDELDFLASLIKEVQDIIKWIEEGGAGGTMNYNLLQNRPQIEGVLLEGNKLLSDFGLIAITNDDLDKITSS